MKTLVKICGMTRVEDAVLCAGSGADFLGYIFYPPSKRYVSVARAGEIISQVRRQYPEVKHVGVFVDEDTDVILKAVREAKLDAVQLHGNERPDTCERIAENGVTVIKALGMSAGGSTQEFRDFEVPFYLCDTYDPKLVGGTGRTFDLALLPEGLPMEQTFLAGGLTPENVKAAIEQVRPYAVDVSSGVEASPGVKSPELVKDFMSSVGAAQTAAAIER